MIGAQTQWSIGGKTLANRFVLAPIKTALNEPGGRTTAAAMRFYRRIAEGGTALLILEPAAIASSGIEHPKQLRLFQDEHISGIRSLVDAVHEQGARVAVHLNHAGRAANPSVVGHPPVAPVATECPATGAVATALREEQIRELIDDFGSAAMRAAAAGADFIELQMGHGYLVHQFMSPRTNQRTDRWADPELFARGVLASVLAGAGSTPVVVRISGNEFVEGGLDPANQVWLLDLLAAEGVAAVHIGFGNSCDNPAWYFGHMALPEQPQIDAFEAIRRHTSLPLIGTGRLGDPSRLKAVLERELIDAVGLARPLLADPDFPRKWIAGDHERILQCGACLQACLAHVRSAQPIACMANPWVTAPEEAPVMHTKRVMIVGAGPAGIGAAITAADRGHDVVLYEQHDYLGGQFAFAIRPSGKSSMARVLKGMLSRLDQSHVRVRLSKRVTREEVERESPDVLIVATGARQPIPEIQGLGSQHVITSYEFFEGEKSIEGDRVLIVGAGMVGVEVAEMAAAMGKNVVACRRSNVIGADMDPISRKLTMKRIQADGHIQLLPSTQLQTFTSDGVEALVDGKPTRMEAFDTVIVCSGTEPEASLVTEANGLAPDIRVIGDAAEPANIETAFAQGIAAGREI